MIVASLLSEELAILLDDVFPDHRLGPPPEEGDWPRAQKCDAEFDRLISGRSLFKGSLQR